MDTWRLGIHRKSGERYPFIGLGHWREQLEALIRPAKVSLEDVMKYQYEEPKKKRKEFQGIETPVYPPGEVPLWEKVKRQVSIMELVENYVELNKKGAGKCPFHDDDNPSFSVIEDENYWHCFAGCGGGSVIDFWMEFNNLDFSEAVKDLAEKLGVK